MSAPPISFPTALTSYSIEPLLRAFRDAPARLRQASSNLSWEEVERRARGPDRWSVKEIVQHVTDAEVIGATRLRMILAGESAVLPVYDQDRWADALAYADIAPNDVHAALALFEALRKTGARLLERATSQDWDGMECTPSGGRSRSDSGSSCMRITANAMSRRSSISASAWGNRSRSRP